MNEKAEAHFSHLRELYNKEINSSLKISRGLTRRGLYPNAIEKQQVGPVLGIFSEQTVAGLETFSFPPETSNFVKIIERLWRIVNVKTPTAGRKQRDPFKEPISSTDCMQLRYLDSIEDWLVEWDNDGYCGLSKPTFSAIIRTIRGLTSLSRYLLTECGFSFVMLGNMQSDVIESRFGMYRQFCGSRYQVSVADIYEAEKKCRLRSLLRLGDMSFKFEDLKDLDVVGLDLDDESSTNTLSQALDEMEIPELDKSEGATVFLIAGYVQKKINDNCCTANPCSYEYEDAVDVDQEQEHLSQPDTTVFNLLNRGGLTRPSQKVYTLTVGTVKYFNMITQNKELKEIWFKQRNQRAALIQCLLTSWKFAEKFDKSDDFHCSCDSLLFRTLANILTNNFTKKENERLLAEKADRKRKKSARKNDQTARKISKLSC